MASTTFHSLLSRFNKLSSDLQEKVHRVSMAQDDVRRCAYEMAVRYCSLISQHTNALIDYVKSEGFTGKSAIDEWRDSRFGIICQLVPEGTHTVIRAVQEGMTEKEFLRSSALVFCGARKAERRGAARSPLVDAPPPPEPVADAPIEERFACAMATLRAQAAQIKELKRDLRDAQHEAAQLREHVNKLIRLGAKAEKALVTA